MQKVSGKFVGNPIGANCSGDLNQGSFLIDYTFNKHFDIYTGVTVSDISGGISSGFLQTSDVAVTSGLRLKFQRLTEPQAPALFKHRISPTGGASSTARLVVWS